MTYSDDSTYDDEWLIAYSAALMGINVPSTTIKIQCIGNLTTNDTWYPLIIFAKDSWNNSNIHTNISLSSMTSPYTCEVVQCTESWYGMTTSYSTGNTTQSATIIINASSLPNSENFRKSTVAHEIGHLFGLDDNPPVFNVNDTLMSHNRDRNVVFAPKAYDVENVKFIYNIN